MLEKLQLYARFVRLDRPIGIYLLLWPTLWALWIAAQGVPDLKILLIFVAGVAVMRSAGCAINDYADRDFDRHVARTKDRPLTTGKLSSQEALGIFLVLGLVALLLVMQLNSATILLAVVAIALAASYPFMKRWHSMPQAHLGAAFGWSVPMAYTAITGELPDLTGWLIFAATLTWTIAYDTLYALADREDDKKIGIKSSARLFGDHVMPAVALFQLATSLILLIIGLRTNMGIAYFTALAFAQYFFLYQHKLVKENGEKAGLPAFLNNNWFGLVIFFGILLDYFLKSNS